ncbi:MAG: cytochrome c biogenesis protein ResB [Planctomycetota bacterium]|jgi:hypothetical protein
MKKIKRFLLSRKTILVQILLILAVVLTGYIFPQKISTSTAQMEKWRDANPSLEPWVDRLGLDHVYTTPWFAVMLGFFLVTLIFSTYDQIRLSFKKTFGSVDAQGKDGIAINASEGEITSAIRKMGYFPVSKNNTLKRFVKYPWGYWGNVLLHLGLVVMLASSLFIFLTEKRGLLHLVEDEVQIPGSPWAVEETGLLAGKFILPEAVRLEKVNFGFWESDKLKHLSTGISFIDPQGRFTRHSLGINKIVKFKGLRVYQSTSFGQAFFVVLKDKQGMEHKIILQIEHPARRDRQNSGSFRDEWIPYQIQAEYFADAEKKSLISSNPLLTILLVDDKDSNKKSSKNSNKDKTKVIDIVSLKIGESRKLGPYTAQLVHVSRWSGMIFVKSIGMSGIFSGFFIIILGVSITFFMPPREFLVRKDEKGVYITWRATKFEKFYDEEYKKISAKFGDDKT